MIDFEEEYKKLLAAIRKVNELHNLSDAIYDVRERFFDTPKENEISWQHSNVRAYSEAVKEIQTHLRRE